jgi:hypothetical protein
MGVPFNAAIDTWSVGVLLCEAWLGQSLFHAETLEGVMDQMVDLLGPLPNETYKHGKFFNPAYSSTDPRYTHILPSTS